MSIPKIDLKPNPKIPRFSPGDTVKVSCRIVESGKERIQAFQGVVIRIKEGAAANFTVRHVAYGVGVERTFPFLSPMVQKVEIIRHGKVRRARLFYLRGLSGKAARIKERRRIERKVGIEEIVPAEEVAEEVAPVAAETALEAAATPETAATEAAASPEAPAAQAASPPSEPAPVQEKPAKPDTPKQK